jgi:hypothetical protein
MRQLDDFQMRPEVFEIDGATAFRTLFFEFGITCSKACRREQIALSVTDAYGQTAWPVNES